MLGQKALKRSQAAFKALQMGRALPVNSERVDVRPLEIRNICLLQAV